MRKPLRLSQTPKITWPVTYAKSIEACCAYLTEVCQYEFTTDHYKHGMFFVDNAYASFSVPACADELRQSILNRLLLLPGAILTVSHGYASVLCQINFEQNRCAVLSLSQYGGFYLTIKEVSKLEGSNP